LDEAIAAIAPSERVNGDRNGGGPREPALKVLTSGPTPPDPDEFQATLAFEWILHEIRSTSDLVLIDAPPLLGFGDAVALTAKVDAILLVTRWSVVRRPSLVELRRVLAGCPAETLGFVLTEADLEGRAAADHYVDEVAHPSPFGPGDDAWRATVD
jgi:Mrp family chromosome partitioning ATPase